jgi:hypothetical protein
MVDFTMGEIGPVVALTKTQEGVDKVKAKSIVITTTTSLVLALSFSAYSAESLKISTVDKDIYEEISYLVRTTAASIEKKTVNQSEDGRGTFCITFKEDEDSALEILESDIEDMFLHDVSIERTTCHHPNAHTQNPVMAGLNFTQQTQNPND